MSCDDTDLSCLLRPRLLVRAARHGLRHYRRNRDLKRILGWEDVPEPGKALTRLLEREERLDHSRRENEAEYRPSVHIDLLIAIIAETMRQTNKPA